jgi:hypothetical protein
MEELEGIGDLILEQLKGKKTAKIVELIDFLSLNEEIVLKAIEMLADEGKVFLPDDSSVKLV